MVGEAAGRVPQHRGGCDRRPLGLAVADEQHRDIYTRQDREEKEV
jgi:hypothetical protein